jgi:hypothetical protein
MLRLSALASVRFGRGGSNRCPSARNQWPRVVTGQKESGIMDMSSFEQVTREEFDRAIEQSRGSAVFRKQYARFAPSWFDEAECMVHLGHLKTEGHFRAPGFFTLITGDLHVDGIVDLQNPEGFDEGGLCVVLGDMICKSFFNEYGKCTFVDGKLEASDLLCNDFGDSALVVTGDVKTKFFYGRDLWAEVGGRASMEYGDGYCLPIGYTAAAAQAIYPKHSAAASRALLNLSHPDGLYPHHFREHMLAEKPLLKHGL